MNQRLLTVGLTCALGLFACDKRSSESQSGPAPSSWAPVVLTDEALDQAPIPVKEDYEEQAQNAITEENLDEQLGQLAKQIREDK
jgi:hypothetical protein